MIGKDIVKSKLRIFSDSLIALTQPPFDCLIQLNTNQSANPTNNKIKFDKFFNSAMNSYKFITCHYDKIKLENFDKQFMAKIMNKKG